MEKFLLLVLLAIANSPAAEAACTLDSLNSELPSLVAQQLRTGQSNPGVVNINNFNVVCLQTDRVRGQYMGSSVVVSCTDSECPTEGFLQIDLNCGSSWSFENIRNDSLANLTTPLRRDCGACNIEASGFPVDTVTHCVSCDPSCNTGLMECTGLDGDDCCIGVVDNMCVSSCPAPQRPLASANFNCTEFCDSLSDPMSGSIDFSDGNMINSTANYSCNENFIRQGNAIRMCQSNGTSTFWTGDAPMCMAVGGTTEAPPACEALVPAANQVISYTSSCTVEINCQAQYSCMDNYELMGGASLRTCSLPRDMVPVWSGRAPRCEQRSNALTQAEIAGIGIGVAVVVAAVLIVIVVIVIMVLSKAS